MVQELDSPSIRNKQVDSNISTSAIYKKFKKITLQSLVQKNKLWHETFFPRGHSFEENETSYFCSFFVFDFLNNGCKDFQDFDNRTLLNF